MTLLTKTLSLTQCQKISQAALDAAQARGLTIAIAIMDNHGNLKFFQRMDGNNLISVRMAPLKALTAASIPISSKELAERSAALENNPYLGVPGIVLLEGGLPIITKDGVHIGAIGVSGATPELDGVCAQAGLNAIADNL